MRHRAWKRKLHSGDEVTIKSDRSDSPVIISEIEYLPDFVVRIVTTNGRKLECKLEEIK